MESTELKNIEIDNCEFSVLDFETTGTSSKTARVIEIGIVKVKNLKVIENYSSLIHPKMNIPYYISNLTGITDDDLNGAPFFEDIAEEILDFIGDSVITAHNIQFDHSFLKSEFTRAGLQPPLNPTLCTLKLARKLLPAIPSKALGKVAQHLRITHKNVHRALGDATVTAKILIKFLDMLKNDHGIETINEVINFQGVPKSNSIIMMKKTLADSFNSLPYQPGVYFFKNRKDDILYIGKAKSLKNRVKNYFYSHAGTKSKKIVRRSSNLSFQITGSELSALIAETELIKEIDPPLNVQLKNYPRTYFIKIDKDKIFTTPQLTTSFNFDGNDYFGPYNNRDTANTLLEIIDKTFLLRECTEKEFAKKKKCYLLDIRRCLAPCIMDNSFEEYNDELNKVYSFLSGVNQIAVDRLLNKMKKFSEEKRYEEAAEIRDTVNLLLDQFNKATLINGPVNKAKVLIKINSFSNNELILLVEGKMFIKDFFLDKKDQFMNALDDYYNGTINIFQALEDKDLERLKISLNWLVKNRTNIKVFYLDDYSDKEELLASVGNY